MSNPTLFEIEDRGYGRGVGQAIHPNGSIIAVGQEADELSAALLREVYSLHLNDAKEPINQ